jgi:hypothetical protein
MAIDRRQLLIGSLVALGASRHALSAEGLAGTASGTYVSGARLADGTYAVLVIADDGRVLREIPMSARGHDIAVDRGGSAMGRRAVIFARRPGFFALAFDVDGRRAPEVFTPPPGRHFYGHGAFAGDGRLVYATEHDVETGDGRIGIYDATGGWRRVGEFPSYGIGPHEAILLSDGRTLAIANGGFGNDPATGRESIGVADMAPNVAFVDIATGALRARHGLPRAINLLSVRHLAETPRGDIWFGTQWQGSLEDCPALIGRVGLDKPIALLEAAGGPLGVALKGYIGAVAVSADGRLLAASAPLAGQVVYLDAGTGKIVRDVAIKDSSGITNGGGDTAFAMSTGQGAVRVESDAAAPRTLNFTGTEFDNHLRRV